MTSITADEIKAPKVDLPAPLVKPFRHPVRFVKNHVVLLAYAILFAHIGLFIVSAIYYGLFETTTTMNNWWHSAVTDSNLRHAIRDVGEGVLGGMLAQAIVYNHFKKSNRRVGKLTGILKRRFHIPTTLAALTAAAFSGAVVFTIAYYIMSLFHPSAAHPNITGSLWHRTYESLWATDFPKRVLGLVAAFGARKPMRVIFDQVQQWFVERRIDNERPTRWYHPPTFRARYNYSAANPDERHVAYATWQNVTMVLVVLVGLGLAGWGYYILSFIA